LARPITANSSSATPSPVVSAPGVSLTLVKPDAILKITLLVAAFASFVLSVTLYFQAGDDVSERLNGIYVGIWVPSILALGALILSGDRRKAGE
jgi:hypothetical protein